MNRNPAYVVSFAACLLFGYAAVLLDAEYPQERKDYILQHAAPQFVLDEENYYQAMACSTAKMKTTPEGTTDAVIVYTSGSTGTPKGIVHSQASCGQAVSRLKNVIGLTPEDIYGTAARFTFAVHCSDLLLPLSSGSSVSLIPLKVMKDPQLLAIFCKNHHITATYMPPSLLRTFDRASDTLKTVIVSGEKVFNIDPKGMRVIATYGMSEAYVMMAEEIRECSQKAYLGKPIGDIGAYVLDENGREVEEGELCVSGVFFTEYLGLPDKTREVLTDNPFLDRDGHEKLLHTRDLVRKLPDGRFEYIDRLDWMVKINGNRVELGEIEGILRALPEIRDVLAKGFTDSQGHVSLCAYYISEPGAQTQRQQLADALAEKVPAYMIPSFFVRLDEFPKNANGKLDRNALELPDISYFKSEYVPPQNELEAQLCQAMAHVLGIDLIGINDDFFELGGDSLRSAVLLSELGNHDLTYSMIYDGRTARRIAQLIAETRTEERTLQMAQRERRRPQPLLPYQTYYLDYQMSAPKQIIATNPICCRFPAGMVTPEDLKEALQKVFRHFAVFGTVFTFDRKSELVQRWMPDLVPDIEISYVLEEAFEKEIKQGFVRPFHLFNSLLWRCGIFVTPENTYVLLDIHHAISDRAMVKNMFRNVFNALAVEPLDDDFYYLYLHEQGELRANAASYAGEVLKELEADEAYSGYPHPDFASALNEQGIVWAETKKTLGELNCMVQEHRISLGNLFLAAGAVALGKYNDAKQVGLRWTYNGRDEAWKEPLLGMLTASISTNIDLEKFEPGEKLLQEVKRQAIMGIRYSAASTAFADLSPGLSERMNIVYQNGSDKPENAPEDTEIKAYFDYHTGTLSMFEIQISEQAEDLPLKIKFLYNSKRYREESAAAFAGLFIREVEDLLQ